MTEQEAKNEIPTLDKFTNYVCARCTSNDWYCTGLCKVLERSKRIPFIDIQKAFARHDGDLRKIGRYINQHK